MYIWKTCFHLLYDVRKCGGSEWDYTKPQRRFYESCPCCLQTAHDSKTANDIEHNNTNKTFRIFLSSVTICPGLPGTVPEWEKMSRVPARSIPGQWNVPEWVDDAFYSFNKHKVTKYTCNTRRFICWAAQSRHLSCSELRLYKLSLHVCCS